MTHSFSPRRGAILIMAIVAMAVLSVVLTVLVAQVVAQRQMVRQRHRQLEAEWLARAGVELAAARLLQSSNAFDDAKQVLLPDSKVRILVEKAEGESFNVTVEAEVGLADGRSVRRDVTSRFRRTEKDGAVKLERVSAE